MKPTEEQLKASLEAYEQSNQIAYDNQEKLSIKEKLCEIENSWFNGDTTTEELKLAYEAYGISTDD